MVIIPNLSWVIIHVYKRLFLTVWHQVVSVFQVVFCDGVHEFSVCDNTQGGHDEQDCNCNSHCDQTTSQQCVHDGLGDVTTAVEST